jgi:chromosome partitioning protein
MRMQHIIAISNQKGGVGKTTTAVNLAACLGAMGHATLLIDMDPQSNATSACGLDVNNLEVTVYDALMDGEQPVIYSLDKDCPGLSILPASVDLAGAEFELMNHPEREYALRRVLSRIDTDYEFVIIDSPPSLGMLTLNTLVAANWLLIPVQAEYLALEGLSRMVLTIHRINQNQNPGLQILGIVATLFDGRTNLAHQVLEELRHVFPDKVFEQPIARSVRLSEAPSFGKPIIYYDERSSGAEQYRKLSEEVIHVCEKAKAGAGA